MLEQSLYEITRCFMLCHKFAEIIYRKESKPKVWSNIWLKWLNILTDLCRCRPWKVASLWWLGFTKENDLLNNNCLVQLSSALQRGKDYLQSFISTSRFLAWPPERCMFLMSSYRILKRFRDLIDKLRGRSATAGGSRRVNPDWHK